MQVKNKNFLITLFSLFFCLLAVITSLWTTPIKVFAEETEQEYVWVDLKVGDTIANKKLRFHGNGDLNMISPSRVIVSFEGGLILQHDIFEPLGVSYQGPDSLIFDVPTCGLDSYIPNEKVEDVGESGGIWEYTFGSSLPCTRVVIEEIEGSQTEKYEEFAYSLEDDKVTDISIKNTDYGVKIQVLMDKEEAVASGRYKVPGDFTLWGITVPVFGVGVVSIICLFALRKVKQSKRSKVYRGN